MKYNWVLPNLAVGSEPHVDEEFQELKALRITAILSLQTDEDRSDGGIEYERAAADRAGLVFCSVPIEDFNRAQLQSSLPDSVAALERMLKQGHSVYVHCSAGVNRSPTVVAAYLHWCLGYELLQALIHLHACRRCLPDAEAIHAARWAGEAGSDG
jgi:protein-tyrosine phosphatase